MCTFINVPGKWDCILQLASPSSPIDYLKIAFKRLKVTSLGKPHLSVLALNKVGHIPVASISEAYGIPLVRSQTEEFRGNVNPLVSSGACDEAKRFFEAMTMANHTYPGLETCIMHFFHTYEPRMRLNYGGVMPAFIDQALRGENLTKFDDGSQTRSFCHVEDLIEGNCRLLMSDYPQQVNSGNSHEITFGYTSLAIKELMGTKQKVLYEELTVNTLQLQWTSAGRNKLRTCVQ